MCGMLFIFGIYLKQQQLKNRTKNYVSEEASSVTLNGFRGSELPESWVSKSFGIV